MRALVPTRPLALLMFIGFVDLIVTAWLHAHGLIIELNPLMRPLIEHSEWLFGAVKAFTLVSAWAVMVVYARQNREFVRKACLVGSSLYVTIWVVWFVAAH